MSGLEISEAKLKILNKMPFAGSLLYSLPVVEDASIITLGVDGETLFYNQEFWDKHNRKEKYGLLMHEAGHLMFKHLWRGRNYKEVVINPQNGQVCSLFNIAGDYCINNMIDSDKRFALPKGCLVDHKYDNWSAEEVYMDLLKKLPKATEDDIKKWMEHSGMCNKGLWNKHQEGKKSKELEQRWNERIKQAAEYAKSQGKEPAWMKRIYEDLNPKEDWRILMREYVQPCDGDYSFSPSDRRYLEEDFILPDIQNAEKIDWVCVAVDTSGSIGDKELSAFLGELKGILSSYDRVKIRLTFCDVQATPFVELDSFDTDKIKASGGGGTDFSPVFDLVKKEETEPKCVCYFTDGMGSFPQHKPDYDVVWISTEKSSHYPWGKVLDYKV